MQAKFVATKARNVCVVGFGKISQKRTKMLQKRISSGMPARVVDDLELIEIQVKQRTFAVVCLSLVNCFFDAALEFLAIQQRGELIVGCLIGELVMHVLQHALRSTFHERHIVVIKQCDFTSVQTVGELLEAKFFGFHTLAVNQHKQRVLITNKGNRQDKRPAVVVAHRQPFADLNASSALKSCGPTAPQIFVFCFNRGIGFGQ